MEEKEKFESGNVQECRFILNKKGQFISTDEKVAEMLYKSEEEIHGMKYFDFLFNADVETGRLFERMLKTTVTSETEIVRGDNTLCKIEVEGKPIVFEGEDCVKVTIELVEEIEKSQDIANNPESDTSNINWTQKCEIAENIRIDTANGTESLKSLLCDIMEGHAKVEKYRKGGLSLCEAIDQRLVEEQARNPDSKECEVLRDSKEMAYELYEKIEN